MCGGKAEITSSVHAFAFLDEVKVESVAHRASVCFLIPTNNRPESAQASQLC